MPKYTKAELKALREAGSRGGKLGAANLTPEQRKERARKAAAARWAKKSTHEKKV